MATPNASKFWTTRNYILAALGGTLAATAVVIAFSVALRPAHISFSVVHTATSNGSARNDDIRYFNLTINAINTSRKRAAVRYLTIFVYLKDSAGSRDKIPTQVYARPRTDEYLRPGTAPAIINAGAPVSLRSVNATVRDFVRNHGLTMVVDVEAQVRFRVAGISTRVYEIKASCPHVFFPVEGPHKPPGTPVDCELDR